MTRHRLLTRHRLWSLAAVGLVASAARAQSVILDDHFDGPAIDTELWAVVTPEAGIDRVETTGSGRLRVLSRGAGSAWQGGAGLWSRPDSFPLIRRPLDESEYNVFFFGVELPSAKQRFALGLYSVCPPWQHTPKFPDDNGRAGGTSYYFLCLPNDEAPADNWLSTCSVGTAGAAADSTGSDGFHTWEYGKVYDLRLQITKDDVVWWGREQPSRDWKMLQDPSAVVMGYNGREPDGRNEFGLFVHVSASGGPGPAWADGDVQIDRILITKYTPGDPQIVLDDDFAGTELNTALWQPSAPEPLWGDRVAVTDGRLRVVNRHNGTAWSGGVGLISGQFPLFVRPTDPTVRVWVDFLGVECVPAKQRFAFGLHGYNPPANPVPKLPDADGPDGGLAYAFWVLPDNDYLPENSNHVRAKVINDHYAATDNYHHAWIWMYGERRDFRIEVTSREVNWYVRQNLETGWRVVRDSDERWLPRPLCESDAAHGYWRPVYDPGVRTGEPYDGTEPYGRNLFGVFVHGSAAGSVSGQAYQDADVTIDRITVTRVRHVPVVDLDTDGDVDVADFCIFQAAFNGPGQPPALRPRGFAADFDADGDVDVADFVLFQACFNGPQRPPACGPQPP